MNPAPAKPSATPKLPELRYSPDVVARMKATGVDPSAAEQRLAGLPRNEAETTWANVTDFYRRNTDASSRVAAYQGPDKNYLQTRASQPINESWTGWNDLGSQFKNSFIDLSQGLADFVPSTVDLAMSAISNPNDTSWYRQWDKATDDYFNKARYYVSPEAQAAVWDDKTGINWKAVAGMTGSTLGFLTTTMLPILGQAGRVGQAASAGSTISRILTDPRLQSGAIGYLQSLPGYKEAALKAGYTRNQAALIAPILSTASAALEFAGADALVKAAKLAPAEASAIVRQLSKESAAEAFQSMAGKQLTEEGFKDVINLTGKRFFDKLKLPEVRSAIFQNIRGGAISEGLEELTQQAAESAIQKMADTYYGYDAPGGKGFDPTIKETLINGVTGVLMGGIVGGSMGGMLGRTPTLVGQQTVWGKLDSDVRNLLNNNPDLDLANNKDGLDIYRLTDRLKSEGKLSDQEYQQARAGLDDMVRVSSRLASTKSDPQMRFALYNLDNQQRQWQQRMQAEVAQPMQRLAELADERAAGEWFPKLGLDTLDLAEATSLISQNLPKKQQLAERIGETINKSVSGLMNEQTRVQTLKSYQSDLDALADQWENGVQSEPEVITKPDQYSEADQPGLYRTMDTPDGRFALANTADGREVFRVETQTEGAQAEVTEDTDPTIKRFKGYKLPSKGRPVVSLRTIADQTKHDELLNAFDANEDVTEPYADWRTRLSDGFDDNQLDGLRQAEASYRQEAANLPADAPDWQKQDLARKRNWLKSAMASRAADSTESRYAQADWISDYLGDELQQAGIDPDKLRELPIDTQSAISEALQTGDYQTANQLANDTVSDTTRPDELPAQLAAATERGRLLANAAAASQQVLERSAVVDQIEQALNAGELTADTEQQLISALADLETALRQESEAIAALNSIESVNNGSSETGTSQQENGVGSATTEQTAEGNNAESAQASSAEGTTDAVVSPIAIQIESGSSTNESVTLFEQTDGFKKAESYIKKKVGDNAKTRGYAQPGNGRLVASSGDIYYYSDGTFRYIDADNNILFDVNGNVLSEESSALDVRKKIEGLTKIRDQLIAQKNSEDFKYKTVYEVDVFGRKTGKKIRRLKTEQELQDSTNSINKAISDLNAEIDVLTTQDQGHLAPPTKRTKQVEVQPIVRQPRDIQESILQFFVNKGKIRRSDFARYADPNLMKGAKGGNPYLNYTAADENAESLDTIARQIVEEQLGRPVDSMDEQQVMQAIVDTVQSFATDGNPRQQLLDYQQQEFEQYNQENDDLVARSTAATPLQALDPLMTAMDQIGMPAELQQNILGIIGKAYVTPDGLDWAGVYDLLQDNGVFQEYPGLKNGIPLYIDNISEQVAVSEAEIEAEGEAGIMSADWWSNFADQYQLDNATYNALINDFYGEPTGRSGQTEENQVNPDKENPGLPDEGNSPSQGSRNSAAENRSEQVPQTLDQQARVTEAQALYDADIASIERENIRLENQADKLRKQLKSRTQTGDIFSQPAAPFNTEGRPASFARVVDVPGGFSTGSVQQKPSRAAVYEIVPIDNNQAIYRVVTDTAGQNLALSDTYSYLNDGTTYANPPSENSTIVTTEPGTLVRNGDSWQITKKAVIRFDTQEGQSELFSSPTGLEAEDSARTKLQDIQDQIDANNDRIKNLQDNKSRIAEIADQAAQQATLFSQAEGSFMALPTALHTGLLARLKETFAGIVDNVQIVDSNRLRELAEIETGQQLKSKGIIYGFASGDTVYLNSDHLNANTPIHEFGHFWNRWAKTNRSDLYKEGIKKARANAAYYEAVANDPFYQQQADQMRLSGKAREEYFAEEALATAIGDQGERFVSAATRKGFLGWLDRLWNAIKDNLGIEGRSAAEIALMDLQEFSGGVAARLLEGRRLDSVVPTEPDQVTRFSYGPAPTANDQPARPIQNIQTQQITDLSDSFAKGSSQRSALLQQSPQSVAQYLKDTFEPMIRDIVRFGDNEKIVNQLSKIRANGQSLADLTTGEINSQALAALAFELTAKKPKGSDITGRLRDLLWEGSESSQPDILTAYKKTLTEKSIINEDGNYEFPDTNEESRDLTASLDIYQSNASDPIFIKLQKKLLTGSWTSTNTLPETVGQIFSLGESSALSRITQSIQRTWQSRASEVRIRRDAQLEKLTTQLQGLSRFASPSGRIGDISQVKQYALQGWINGKSATVDLPIGDWIDIYHTIKTQLSTTSRQDPNKATSSALADLDTSGNLIPVRRTIDNDGSAKTSTYGYQYTAPGEDRPQTILISKATYDQLESQLLAEHGDVLQTLAEITADPVAISYTSGLYEVEKGERFPLEADYYPTQKWASANDRNSVPTVDTVLENIRQLKARKTPPAKVVGRDVISRLSSYANMENRYIANSATRLNLDRWRKRNAEYVDQAPKWLTKYLDKLGKDLNDPLNDMSDESPFEFEVAGIDLGLRAMMRRFSESTFGLSITTPVVQFTTAMNLYGMGIIDNKYLTQALPVLAKLGIDSYNLARQSAKTNVFGGQLAEVSYMEKAMRNPYLATVINRISGNNEAYLGRPSIEDIKAQPVNGTVAAARKIKQDITDVSLRWVRAADRGVVLYIVESAELQVADRIANGQLKDQSGNTITDINSDEAMREIASLAEKSVYATNTMPGEASATPLQRNRSLAGAILGLYTGQQSRLFNTVLQSMDRYLKARALGDPEANSYRDRAIWTAANLMLFNSLAVSLIHLLYKSITGLLTGDEPPENILAELSWDVGRGILGSAPSVPTEFLIAASTWVDEPRWDDSVLSFAPADAAKKTVDGLIATKDYLTTDDPKEAARRWNTMTYSLTNGMANLGGLPAQLPKLAAKIARDEPIKEEDISGF